MCSNLVATQLQITKPLAMFEVNWRTKTTFIQLFLVLAVYLFDTTRIKSLFNSNFLIPISYSLQPFKFRTMNTVRSNNLSLKYQWFAWSGCKDIGISKFLDSIPFYSVLVLDLKLACSRTWCTLVKNP